MDHFKSINDYIAAQPELQGGILSKLVQLVESVVPDATGSISYGMPTYKLNKKVLIHFAAYKNHIGLYATPTGHDAFKKELEGYVQGKGSVRFQLDEEIPYTLIKKIILFRKKQLSEK